MLEADSQPALPRLIAAAAVRGNGVGEDEKAGAVAAAAAEAPEKLRPLAFEHRLQARAADIVVGRAIEDVADDHVVSRHRFRNGGGGVPRVEKPARHFLPRADFSESAVFRRIEIDRERLFLRA